MELIHLVLVAAFLQYIWFGWEVGRLRGKHGISAPATVGNPEFERMFRVQQNTLEQLVVFVPALMLAAQYQDPRKVAILGAVFIAGREIYRRTYLADPKGRSVGFTLTFGASVVALVIVAWGAVRSLT